MFFGTALHETQAAVAVISQMIAPAIFILACGNLLNSAQVRVGRVVDRARALLEDLPSTGETSAERSFILEELDIYRRRSSYLESAMTSMYAAIAIFVGSSLLVAINVLVPQILWLPTITTVLGALFLLFGSMQSLLEVRLATGMLRVEIERRSINEPAGSLPATKR
jgi:hypothetical protein